jgi:L,D-transpeptidase ErfK/SrfK
MTRSLLPVLGTLLLTTPAFAAPSLPVLGPGRIVGSRHEVTLPRGMSIDGLASRFGVHPVRIVKPSWGVLKDGLQRGERLTVDQRRIEPLFDPHLTGLVLNIPEAQLYRVENGKLLRDYPVGVSRSDWQAPIGRTQIVAMEKDPVWVVPKSIQAEMEKAGREVIERMEAGPGNPLGSRWIGFGNGSYGFHGTTVPTSIKRYASHGCVRMLAPHLQDLYGRVTIGMPVYVYYQPVLLAADPHGIWLSAYPDIYGRKPDRIGMIRTLAEQAGVLGRVDWKAVARVLQTSDGMVVNIATAGGPLKPKPLPTGTPTAVPSLRPSATPTPKATPGILPTPTATPTPAAPPTPAPQTSAPAAPQDSPAPEASATASPSPSASATVPAATESERPL